MQCFQGLIFQFPHENMGFPIIYISIIILDRVLYCKPPFRIPIQGLLIRGLDV